MNSIVKKEMSLNRGLVLIVEDNAFMAELMDDKISNKGFETKVVHNGKEALDFMTKSKPSVVIIDLPLVGEMSGLDLVVDIRKNHDKKDVSILCLFNQKDSSKKSFADAGINAFINKPIENTDEIVIKIEEILLGNIPDLSKIEEEKKEEEKIVLKIKIPEQKNKEAYSQAATGVKIKIDEILSQKEDEISIIDLVDLLIEYSFLARSSDIHLEPTETELLARLRIDGMLHDVFKFPKSLHSGVVTRIKVLAGTRTDEHQTAQDGRFKTNLTTSKRKIDIRVSIVPTYFGENAVLRLLAEQTQISTLDDLALTQEDKERIREAVKKPYGMILATGPTGSGKSTTLYTILRELNVRDVSIITIEDPIEYSIEGIDQIQVNSRTGLTFANGLRSILRQDPNVIMVGEIRDEETASIAVNAALTGHKLLSTLHTNDAATTLPRLLDMGIEPFLVASTINIAIGQRLVRVLCQSCKEKKTITEAEFISLSEIIPPEVLDNNREFYFAKGCDVCGGSGYYDRMGIYEILEINDFIRDAIVRRADAGELKKIAVKNGMITLLEDGFRKALAGYTTIEELLRVVHE